MQFELLSVFHLMVFVNLTACLSGESDNFYKNLKLKSHKLNLLQLNYLIIVNANRSPPHRVNALPSEVGKIVF